MVQKLNTDQVVQNYLFKDCCRHFNERTGTPMARLRTPLETVSMAINARGEGLGIRATAHLLNTGAANIITCEQRVANQLCQWSPPAPNNGDVTLEGDELYTRIRENLPPERSQGWTLHFIERTTRDWVESVSGLKDATLFETGVSHAWQWAKPSQWIRWFTDGERRYGQHLWALASVFLPDSATPSDYRYRKVWRLVVQKSLEHVSKRVRTGRNGDCMGCSSSYTITLHVNPLGLFPIFGEASETYICQAIQHLCVRP